MNKSIFAIAAALALMIAAAGCATEVPKHGKFEETEYFPDGSIKKKTVAGSDYSMYLEASKAAAPMAEVALPAPGGGNYSIKIPMVAAQQNAIAPPVAEKGFWDVALDRTERLLSLGLQGYGINRNAAVQMRVSDNQTRERIAVTQGNVDLGGAIRDTANGGFLALGQVPRTSNINVTGNALLGDGNLNVNSNNTTRTSTRNCAGGAGANGGNGAATTTGPSGAQGGSGGPATC